MKYIGKAEEVINQLIAAFEGDNIAEPLATVFIKRNDPNIPMHGWSLLNQLACLVAGHTDGRGFKQWQEVGRKVTKGERAKTRILIPLTKKKEGEEGSDPKFFLYGFKGVPVFDISQTEGAEIYDQEDSDQWREWLNDLPLMNVAHFWNIETHAYSGRQGQAYGCYSRSMDISGRVIKHRILLGVENLSTWLHELMHAADHKLGNAVEKGQHWRKETVAEIGGAALAYLLDYPEAADAGGAYRYLTQYAETAGKTAGEAARETLERTAAAINLILETAETLAEAASQ